MKYLAAFLSLAALIGVIVLVKGYQASRAEVQTYQTEVEVADSASARAEYYRGTYDICTATAPRGLERATIIAKCNEWIQKIAGEDWFEQPSEGYDPPE